MHSSTNIFLFFSVLVLFFKPMQPLLPSSSSETKFFDLKSLPHGYLTFLGDSHPHYGGNANAIALTKEGTPTDVPRSTGMVLYSRPILFLDPHLKTVPSFSTMFAFSMENIYGDGEDSGDGLAFLISADDHLIGSPGYLGLADSTDLTKNKFIAIEFDTKCDSMFQDPDDNHLGLNINSLSSVHLATSSSLGVNLKSGNLIRSWIDYKGDEKRLEVYLSYLDLKPVKPRLEVDIDLSNYMKENMFVGFSAATGKTMQRTFIEQWQFTIVEHSPPLLPSSPSPSPSLDSGTIFAGHRHSHLSGLAIGLTVGVCFVPFVVFGWFCWKKLTGMIQKLEGTKNLAMQTISSSGGNSEIRIHVPNTNLDEVGRGLVIEKVLDNETQLIRVKTVKFIISPLQQFANDEI